MYRDLPDLSTKKGVYAILFAFFCGFVTLRAMQPVYYTQKGLRAVFGGAQPHIQGGTLSA